MRWLLRVTLPGIALIIEVRWLPSSTMMNNLGSVDHPDLLVPLAQVSSSLLLPELFKLLLHASLFELVLVPPDILFDQLVNCQFIQLILRRGLCTMWRRSWLHEVCALGLRNS